MNPPAASMKPVILVAPLDWGLGHATRCIPLISCLLRNNCDVLLAGEEPVKSLLQQQFPDLPFLQLEGYRMTYSKRQWATPLVITSQIPKMLHAIAHEHQWLQKAIKQYGIQAVISDNRYGLYHHSVPTVFLSHQLLIKTPFGKWTDNFLQQLNYYFIQRFTECWVPDEPVTSGWAGILSHPAKMPVLPIYYTGILSRFAHPNKEEKADGPIVILLSGPEPQRTFLENKCIKDLEDYSLPAILVRGLPAGGKPLPSIKNMSVFNHLPSDQLQLYLEKASFVVARSGYSTVMDLAVLGKKAILIPTPGQTEQEYLATLLMSKKLALTVRQSAFRLQQALELAKQFPYEISIKKNAQQLEETVKGFLKRSGLFKV